MSTDTATTKSSFSIDAELAEFLETGLSAVMASRDANNMPNVCRAVGCKVSRDRRQVTLLVSARQALGVLADLRATGDLAVTFSEPPTHRALQIKGKVAKIAAATKADMKVAAHYRERFVDQVVSVGYPEDTIRTFITVPDSDLVAVTFAPEAVFAQTPGPGAGAPLKHGGRL